MRRQIHPKTGWRRRIRNEHRVAIRTEGIALVLAVDRIFDMLRTNFNARSAKQKKADVP